MRPPGSVCDVPCGIGVQLHASRVPCQIFIIPLGADHGAVVATEFQRRQVQPDGLHLPFTFGKTSGGGGEFFEGKTLCKVLALFGTVEKRKKRRW